MEQKQKSVGQKLKRAVFGKYLDRQLISLLKNYSRERFTNTETFDESKIIPLATDLLEKGANVNCRDSLGKTPLILAAQESEHSITTKLLARITLYGADVNACDKNGCTALMAVARRGDAKSASLLLKKGAGVNLRDNEGQTALMRATTLYFDIETVKLLLESGADVNARNLSGQTTLMLATKGLDGSPFNTKQIPSIIKMLLEKGADPNIQDNDKATSLMLAARLVGLQGVRTVAKLLVQNGANVQLRNDANCTAADIARAQGTRGDDLADYLKGVQKFGVDWDDYLKRGKKLGGNLDSYLQRAIATRHAYQKGEENVAKTVTMFRAHDPNPVSSPREVKVVQSV